MAGQTDQVKGQVKQAVGTLTGDEDLESEGKADRRAGEAKEKVEHAKGTVEDVIDMTITEFSPSLSPTESPGRARVGG
jgi:uncharacterized protein YjbJ (UPF0337 family)